MAESKGWAWYKDYPETYLTGKIMSCSLSAQGVWAILTRKYFSRRGEMTVSDCWMTIKGIGIRPNTKQGFLFGDNTVETNENLKAFFEIFSFGLMTVEDHEIKSMDELKDVFEMKVAIKFLDEIITGQEEKSLKRSESGRKGGGSKRQASAKQVLNERLANANQVLSKPEASAKQSRVEKRREEESIKVLPSLNENEIKEEYQIKLERFQKAYNQYPKTKRLGNERNARSAWDGLSEEEMQKAEKHIPKYASSNDHKFLKKWDNYIYEKEFNVELENNVDPDAPPVIDLDDGLTIEERRKIANDYDSMFDSSISGWPHMYGNMPEGEKKVQTKIMLDYYGIQVD